MDFSFFSFKIKIIDFIDYIVKSDHERNHLCSLFSAQTVERVKRKE